ncbi:MAG: helix-turn-helix domain-containing protein [Monoglobaceae bacterium]|nr:excisionase [Ruminococcus sp.]
MQESYVELITIDELCELLMIGRSTAYNLLRSNEIKAFKIGKVWKISKASVERYIKERSNL